MSKVQVFYSEMANTPQHPKGVMFTFELGKHGSPCNPILILAPKHAERIDFVIDQIRWAQNRWAEIVLAHLESSRIWRRDIRERLAQLNASE